jgi:hypothetical protein
MDEPRPHDDASLTDQVRRFRRMARLAAADPLRLLPIDALARLASLSAPAAELIDLAPFERLRHALTAPAAAPRRETPRSRVQPLASAGSDVLRTAAAAAIAPAPQPVGRDGAPPRALREPPSTPASLSLAGEPLRPGAATATSLADRRAALRRRTSDAGSSPAAASPLVTREAAATGSRISANAAHEIGPADRGRKVLSEEIDDQSRRLTSVPFDPITVERGSVASGSSERLASAALDRATNHESFSDDVRTAPAPTDRSSASTPPVAVDLPVGHDPSGVPLPGGPHPGLAALPRALSSPVAGRWPETARTQQADSGLGARRRAWEPEGDSDLADSLFETLYRDGVDLPWP